MQIAHRKEQGLTLIEMIISIVILSLSLSSLFALYNTNAANNATPMIREQAVAIASAYLDMTLLHAFDDPGIESGGCEEGVNNRSAYDDVNDFSCINDTDGARDAQGNLIAGLEAYNVAISVNTTTLAGAVAKRIEVHVTRDQLESINTRLVAFRTAF